MHTWVITDSICSAMQSVISWWVKIFLSLLITFRTNVPTGHYSPPMFVFVCSPFMNRPVYIAKDTYQFCYKSFWHMQKLLNVLLYSLLEKCPNTEFFLVLIFPYPDWIRRVTVNLRIQSEYRKIRTRKNFVFGHFSRSDCCPD